MRQWTAETESIITSHKVNSKTYQALVGKDGYGAYVKSLGGVFARQYGHMDAITTVEQLHERIEYVSGLMYIFGICYWNKKTWWFFKNKASESFYSKKNTSRCREGTIGEICTGKDGRTRITNCNYGVSTVLRQCGIYSLKKHTVKTKSKLQPGDVIDFYRKSDGKWHHQAIVHSIEGSKIWLADYGNRFIKTGKPLHYMSLTGTAAGGEYGTDKWIGRHRITLKKGPEVKKSSLTNIIILSPNEYGRRTAAVDRITPHCMVGQMTAESCGNMFAKSATGASSNYGIGTDGKVGLYVSEDHAAWCSSDQDNDQRAITIECASDATHPYAFNDKVYAKLVDLCTDICQRYGKKRLIWWSDKAKTLAYAPKSNEMMLTVHRWFAQKACPGDWMFARMAKLADEVNERLNKKEVIPVPRTLKRGSTGKLVKMLQIFLGGLTVDGKYGQKTEAAVKKWQKNHKLNGEALTVDGVVGAKTWRAILLSLA